MITSSHGSFRKAKTKRSDWVTFHLHLDSKKPIFLFAYSGTKGSWFEPFFRCEPGFHRYLLIGVSYDFHFFFERKDMTLKNLPNILNMVIRHIENFLRAFEKSFAFKKWPFWSIALYFTNPILRVNFSKSKLLLRFLPYNLFDVSYNSNSFSSVKIRW